MQKTQWIVFSFILPLCIYILNILAIQHFGLSADGAHYALYGQHLSLGYIDHPPLIGWLQALMMHCFGRQDWVMHIVPLFFSVLCLCTLYAIATKFNLYRNKLVSFCFIAVVWNALTFLAITQTPLIFFCLFSIYCFLCWCEKPNLLKGLALGVSLGFAGLADYAAFLVALGLFIYCCIYQPKHLLKPSFYLAIIIAIALVSPFIWWNYQHHWVSFTSGYNHSFSGSFSWHWFSQTIAIQLLGYSPALVIFALIGSVCALKDKQKALLALPGLLVILAITIAGMHHKIFFHWPALGWIILAPLAYQAIHDTWASAWTKVIVMFSILLSGIVYLAFYIQAIFAPFNFPLGKNPLIDLYGWQQAGQQAKQLAEENNLQTLYVPNWSLASRLAWYSDLPVQILQPSPIAGYKQFVLWYGQPKQPLHGILVIPYKWRDQASSYSQCKLIKTLPIKTHQSLVNQINFYQCS